jgi:flagellin-like protein
MRSKKGISPILATLLLIVIAVAAVIVTYAWVLTFTTTQTQQAGAVLVKENVRFYGSNNNRTDITIRNTGSASGKIVAIYWSDSSFKELAALTSSEYTMSPSTGVVSAGSSITITIKWEVSGGTISATQWTSGSTYYFKIVTDSGAFIEFSEKAP